MTGRWRVWSLPQCWALDIVSIQRELIFSIIDFTGAKPTTQQSLSHKELILVQGACDKTNTTWIRRKESPKTVSPSCKLPFILLLSSSGVEPPESSGKRLRGGSACGWHACATTEAAAPPSSSDWVRFPASVDLKVSFVVVPGHLPTKESDDL